ncbi:cytochrome c oxidase subunit 3 [Flexithrix dorotheae]|uniref:cytochrome c oxidase subunit 3 n=1 Tax=Flexithrix dorotheae TaxID=70993 RepID=UPI000379003F|nr:cytochrome c oxidase subunit 3 [Flexithrix dorotheae]
MNSGTQNIENVKKPIAMNAKKFGLWLFMVSVVMLFAALTSAYIVRQAEGNWYVFELPELFTYSTITILLSSVTMHWAYISAKKDNLEVLKTAMSITAILGVAFLVLQFFGWGQMVDLGAFFSDTVNPSGSFVYVITGLHGLHIVSAVIFLLVVLVKTYKFKVHSKNLNTMEMCVSYWHFLDVLWIYLFVFLLLNR